MRPSPDSPLRLVIFDLDGVVYRGPQAVPGVPPLIARLHDAGIVVRYATNNSMLTPAAFVTRLATIGVAAEPHEIVTSTTATLDHLQRHLPEVRRVLTVGESGLLEMLSAAGYQATPADEALPPDYRGEPLPRRYDAVIAGLDLSFSFAKLAAARAAIAAGARFVATNADARYPTERGFLPGAGSMVAAIATASGEPPLIIGKPQPAMFAAILEREGVPAHEALVIGDNPDADIVAAQRAGIRSVLMLTGVANAATAAGLLGERKPDHVVADAAQLAHLLEERLLVDHAARPSSGAPPPEEGR
ncbi:MAG TPA: HAD-IIA family hydrolase [Candidatus Limnocylindria bacterium]|nr:HAD-IIA family hydrolase [Candidatus Limnocylindria bacterium]